MSDWESLRAEAHEIEAEDRIHRINARRWNSINSASEEPPAFICGDCGLDGDCECPEEIANEIEGNDVRSPIGRADQTQTVGPARPAPRQGVVWGYTPAVKA